MKKTLSSTALTTLLYFLFTFSSVQAQTYLYEDFETGVKPIGWSYIYESGNVAWVYLDGGFSNTGIPGTGHPQYAKEGLYNAMFHKESFSGEKTKLVTPEINLEFGIKPELAFWHGQDERYTFEQWNNDELRVYYKTHVDSSWKKIAEYTEKVNVWTERIIQLPDSTLSSTYYIAFEGKTSNGYGVCIDSVAIVEKGKIARYIESIEVKQASTEFIASESDNNAILQINFIVKGNDGELKLDSLAVKSINTDDSDIETNGIKIYASNDNSFSNSSLIATSSGFTEGYVQFDDLNRSLPTGLSSIWITYDIVSDIDHTKHEHTLDAMIESQSIKINNSYYPILDKSPDGERVLYESILYDDFETDKGWVFTGEFERNVPSGLGGVSKGSPDPDYAVSGNYIIGTDLSGQGANPGDYELNLTDRAYSATSPYLNCKYYKDTYIYFQRWFNMDSYDQATIDVNTKKADNWETLWQSSGTSINNNWTTIKYNLDSVISRTDSVKFRYTLGPTNEFWNFSGWNIDNVIVVGNYIGRDVAITEWISPLGGCGNSDEEYVTVKIKNLAGEPMDEPLPISFSFDEGATIYYDTIQSTIAVDDSLIYIIDKPIDLSSPGWYPNVYVKTLLAGDEELSNDTYTHDIFISPTYTLPHTQDFENNYGYYLTGGTDISWEYGTPGGILINDAASGTKAWATNLISDYNAYENSYIESPCFDFSGNQFPIFEFKCKGYSLDSIAGLAVHYSINEGETWNTIPKNGDYYWNWLSDYDIRALGSHGIDSTKGQWLTYRQLLPPDTKNNEHVKFRFLFASDSSDTKEGFAIDDIKVYEAPPDVGITGIDYPYHACEWTDTTHLKVFVKNFGLDTLKSGQRIPVTAKLNTQANRNDTIILIGNILPGDSALYAFNSTFDLSYAGSYRFEVSTKLESNSTFYKTTSNDTFTDTIVVYGMPRYDAFFDVIGDNPVDTILDAGAGYTYLWQDASTNQTFHALTEGTFKVTVTNDSSCVATDSTVIYTSLIDLKLDTVYAAFVDSCERNALTEISVRFINDGFEGFGAGDSILFAYQINDEEIVLDSLWLTDTLPSTSPGDTAFFTFQQKCDFRTPGEYHLKVFTNFAKDINHYSDTVSYLFNTWGYVTTNLEKDTINSSQADTLQLIANPGIYTSYSWNSGQTNDTITPTNKSYYYKVTVSDDYICGTESDSTYIETYDFGITAINGFNSNCDYSFAPDSVLNVEIKNHSGNDYTSGDTIRIVYKFDTNDWIVNTLTLTGDFNANSSQNFDIGTVDASSPGNHSFKIYTSASMDANHSNDTITKSFETWPFPDVSLAYDTIFTTKPDTITLQATLGYPSYLWTFGSTSSSLTISREYSENYVIEVQDDKGCGTDKDSTQIITYNIGATDILYPKNACTHKSNENVIITVTNFSRDTLKAGEYIDLSYKINENSTVTESFLLETDFSYNKTHNFIFAQKADLSAIDTFYIKAYTQHELDVRNTNDTLVDAIQTFGFSSIDLGDDIFTDQPDTVRLIAEPGYIVYNWNNGEKDDTLNITYPATYKYKLTVTNINGCSTTDSISLYTYDVGIASINTPNTTCELSNSEVLNVSVLNSSQDTLLAGETINLSYELNGEPAVNEVFTLVSDLLPDSTAEYSFLSNLDLSSASNHNLKVTSSRTIDVNNSNDTLSVIVEAVGYPSFSLGSDLFIANPVGTELTGPGAYASYLWQDGSSLNAFTVTYPASAQYALTVSDIYGCEGSDTIEIFTYDLGISSINTPATSCEFSDTETLNVSVLNNSQDTILTGETVDLSYVLNEGLAVNEVFTLLTDLLPDSTADYSFVSTLDLSSALNHNIKVTCSRAIDVDDSNDTLSVHIEEVGYPSFSLGNDIFTSNPVGTELTGPGAYASYQWQDGSSTSTFNVSYPASAQYALTVTDSYGCEGSDTVEIYTYDLGASTLISPISQCKLSNETIILEIKNNSKDTILIGDSVTVAYQIASGSLVSENLTLTNDLLPDSTLQHTFSSSVDLSADAEYTFKLFASYLIDVNKNDTITAVIEEYGYPEFNLGDDLYVLNPTGTQLVAPESYASYAWQDGSSTNTFTISYPASAEYSVTVTDSYGCSNSDTLHVYTYNLAADSLATPFTQCELTNTELVKIGVINHSLDTLQAGDALTVAYRLNAGSLISELFTLTEVMYPDSMEFFSLTAPADLSANQSHNFKLFAKLNNRDVFLNDTSDVSVDFLKPDFDLGEPEVIEGSEFVIEPGSFDSYLWFDESTDPNYTVDINNQNPNHFYAVTVTNNYGCIASDSLEVSFTTKADLEVTSLTTPISDCWVEAASYPVHIVITNSGVVDLNSGTNFIVGYRIDGGTEVTENFNLSAKMQANDTREHTFTSEISFASAKTYEFKSFVKLLDDEEPGNDTLVSNIDISAPEVDFVGISDTVHFPDSYTIQISGTYLVYEWSTNESTPSIEITTTGLYSVTVTDEYGCQGEGSIYCINQTTGVENVLIGNDYQISYYPNPASEKLMIQFENKYSSDAVIEIISSSGQILYHHKFNDVENTIETIDVNPFSKGVYYLRFKINNDFYIRKVIIQ